MPILGPTRLQQLPDRDAAGKRSDPAMLWRQNRTGEAKASYQWAWATQSRAPTVDVIGRWHQNRKPTRALAVWLR